MSKAEERLARDRAARNSARGLFDSRFNRLKGEVEEHGGVAGRLRFEAERKLEDAAEYGLAVARESKGVVAGTVAALGLWLFRKPLGDAVKSLFSRTDQPADVQDHAAMADPNDEEHQS